MTIRLCFILMGALMIVLDISAQDKCATVEILKKRRDKAILFETDDVFEDWMSKAKSKSQVNRPGPYIVPVVVHIIHKGEAVGVGTNLSIAQIESQIAVLNQDFNRTNGDASNTPSEFRSVAGQIQIEFVLAKQDPNGNATNGVVRARGSESFWTIEEEDQLKATSYWPAEDYLNIWVTDLSSTLLGYAQFPVSNLEGLESAVNNRKTDGIVVDYSAFGSEDFGFFNLEANFRKGRATTHEVGHFFGLRHTWGDDNGSCSGRGDYVSDTPNQGTNTSGCPSHPQTSCSIHTMFQNYMDYTNDNCKNLFTLGQVARMETVLENSPRRLSLLSSPGAYVPVPVMNSLAIVSTNLGEHECMGIRNVSITITNDGINEITSAKFSVRLGDDVNDHYISFESPLKNSESMEVSFGDYVIESGSNIFSAQILTVNDVADENEKRNSLGAASYAYFNSTLPYSENFDSMPATWYHHDMAGNLDWTFRRINTGNTAMALSFFNAGSKSTSNYLFTPAFDLTASQHHYLVFDVAYAQSKIGDKDGLKIYAFSDCGNDPIETGSLIFEKYGTSLSTSAISSVSFAPSSVTHWRQEVIDISAFSGQENVRFAFRGINDMGNNMYIDNVRITRDVSANVSIVRLEKPGPIHCKTAVSPSIAVKNLGSDVIESITVIYDVNTNTGNVFEFSGLNLGAGQEQFLALPEMRLDDGVNTLDFELIKPNGLFDIDISDNSLVVQSFVDGTQDLVPLRQDFEDPNTTWAGTNPAGTFTWEGGQTNFGTSMVRLRSANRLGESWIASPMLNLSTVNSSSLYYNLAFVDQTGVPKSNLESTGFEVMISTDCGVTYQSLATESVPNDPVPEASVNWLTMYSSLTPYAGQSSVRLAFVVENFSEYKTYLDNIEIFLSDDFDRIIGDRPYSLYDTDPDGDGDLLLTFNLSQRQHVNYTFVDITGKIIDAGKFDHVLNQTFTLQPFASTGIYVLKLTIGNQAYSSRVLLGR